MGTLDQLFGGDAARFHAGPAHADGAAAPGHRAEHHLDVVVALGDLLASLRAGGGVAQQEDANLLAFSLGERAGQPQRVVAALGSVRRIVEDE
jgi:hypothetical protein